MPPTSRRDLAGAFSAMLLLTAAEAGPAKAEELDGELIRATQEAIRLNSHTAAALNACKSVEEESEVWNTLQPAYEAMDGHLELVIGTPCRTPEGFRAKAMVVADWQKNPLSLDPDRDLDDRLVASLLRDLLGRAGA